MSMNTIQTSLSTWRARSRLLLLAAAALVGVAIVLLSLRIDAMDAENNRLQRKEEELAARLALPVAGDGTRLASLLLPLPAFEALTRVTADTQRLFKDAGLTLRDAAHTPLNADTGGEIGQVEIAVHLKGDYPATKKAIAALLAGHDELALKSLTMTRDQAADGAPQIETRFTLYYRRQQ
jgi:hypothetical protein